MDSEKARKELEYRRRHAALLYNKSHSSQVLKHGVSFPECDPEKVIEEYKRIYEKKIVPTNQEQSPSSGGRLGLTYEETNLIAVETLRSLGPEPFPLLPSLRQMGVDIKHRRLQDMRFRIDTELPLPVNLPVQNPWMINANIQFHLGITNINLNAWATYFEVPPLFCNNSWFRSLDIPMFYYVNGEKCTMNTKIYMHGSVVMIGVRPIEKSIECAHHIVNCLRKQGVRCSVTNLVVNNLVVGFDLGNNLNLEAMLQAYPEQLVKDRNLPMLSYYPSGKKKPVAFLFRTGCGLIPGAQCRDLAVDFFLQIYRDAKPFLYHGTNITDNTDIEDVTGVVPDSAGIEDMMKYMDDTHRDAMKRSVITDNSEMLQLMDAFDDDGNDDDDNIIGDDKDNSILVPHSDDSDDDDRDMDVILDD